MNYPLHNKILIAFAAGTLFFFIHHQIIIVRNPFFVHQLQEEEKVIHKKMIPLFLWQNNAWHDDYREIIWPTIVVDRLKLLIKTWLVYAHEEQLLKRKIFLQGIALSPTHQDAYISFDRTIFDKQASIFEKTMVIESLLKTIRENEPSLYNIYFLVNHQPLNDAHLDFLHAWPIQGFINNAQENKS